jgi:hypothetical protein
VNSLKRNARLAGVLYLLMGIPAWFSLLYIPGRLLVRGNAPATAANLLANEGLFRLAVAAALLSTVMFLFLALVLYRLFGEVSRNLSLLLLILVLVQVPMGFLNEVSSLAAMKALHGSEYLSVFSGPQRQALSLFLLTAHSQGIYVSEVFWGLWLIPFGLLVHRCGFIPRALGIWLLVNGAGYVALSLIGVLAPDLYSTAFRDAFPLLLGELAIQLWLLVVGARPRAAAVAAA